MNATDFQKSSLHVMAKPIGPICNLDCEYCYYLHKENLYSDHERWKMTGEQLESFVRQYIEAQPASAKTITFAWQGGEPTLLGVAFFRRAVEFQQKHKPDGVVIENAFQTNGVLIDDEWCEFFLKNKFLIGLSMDGPADLHDRYRYDKKGDPTFAATLNAMKQFKQHGVEFNVLVCVNRHNADHGKRVYSYLRDTGAKFFQFIPIVEQRGVGQHPEEPVEPGDHPLEHLVSSRSVLPDQFGRFLVSIFDEWIRRDVGKVFVQIFDQALSAWMGMEPSLCVFKKDCGRALAIEHNGDLYSCDHFVEPDYKLGNIADSSLADLANSDRQLEFANAKSKTLPQYCLDCEVRFVCNGECPKNRFIDTPSGEAGLNYLCDGYRTFFNHIDPWMKKMAAEVKAGRPAANAVNGKGKSSVMGRNDPCRCGSGRKFKKCCGSK
jgi:uncharacterized protein